MFLINKKNYNQSKEKTLKFNIIFEFKFLTVFEIDILND